MSDVKSVSPKSASEMIEAGAVLVDIREADERLNDRIPSARHVPLSMVASCHPQSIEGQPVIFHCRSGRRTEVNAQLLAAKAASVEVFVLEGGIEAWRAAGLPVEGGQ